MGSLLFTLAALEGLMRAARARRGGGKEANEPRQYNEYDPLLGWRKKPGARVWYHRREYTVEVAINSRGLRDPERPAEAPPGTWRVLALGDSFLEGYSVPLEQTVTQVLERDLGRLGCRAEVVNGGTQAYSTDQQYLFYRSEGVKYAPRVVAVFFYYNDVVYNDRQEYFEVPKPIFEMGGGTLRLHRYPVKPWPEAHLASEAQPAEQEPSGSALIEWLRDRLWYGAPRAHNALARLGLWAPMPRVPVRLELRVYERRTIPEIEDAWAKTRAILLSMAEEVRAHGSALVLVAIPSRFEVDERSWQLTRALYDIDEGAWDRGRVMARLREIATEGAVPFLDLTEPLRRANQRRGERPYYTYDGHWTRVGHEVAARELLALMRGQGWLRACAP